MPNEKDKTISKWGKVLEGIKDDEKRAWMDNYIDAHDLSGRTFEAYQVVDSGETCEDFNFPLLPISKRIAAQTIGLDLVSVVPLAAPQGYESDENRIKRENYNKRLSLHNKLNKIKEGEYKPKPKKSPPFGLNYMDFKYGSKAKPKRIKRKKNNGKN